MYLNKLQLSHNIHVASSAYKKNKSLVFNGKASGFKSDIFVNSSLSNAVTSNPDKNLINFYPGFNAAIKTSQEILLPQKEEQTVCDNIPGSQLNPSNLFVDDDNKAVGFYSINYNDKNFWNRLNFAIQESINKGFKGKITCCPDSFETVTKLYNYGFVFPPTMDPSYKNSWVTSIKTGNAGLYAYEKFFPVLILPKEKVQEFQTEILKHIPSNTGESKYLRGQFTQIPPGKIYTIGPKGNIPVGQNNCDMSGIIANIKLRKNGNAVITNLTNNPNIIMINNQTIAKNKAAQLSKYDVLTLGNELYLFNGKGIRLIHNNAAMIKALFPEGLNIPGFQQGRLDDCYFLAPLISLSKHPTGLELLPKFISKNSNGDIVIKFPGYQDLPLTLKGGSFDSILSNTKLDGLNLEELKQQGLKSNSEGFKFLELALIMLKKQLNWPGSINKENGCIYKWVGGGYPEDMLHLLTGATTNTLPQNIQGKDILEEHFKQKPEDRLKFEKELTKLAKNTQEYLITASTPTDPSKDPNICTYIDVENKLYYQHVVAVTKIDPENKTINIIDPFHTDKERKLTYDEFYKYFRDISFARLNFEV